MRCIFILLFSFCALYAYNSTQIENCQQGYTQSCLILAKQAQQEGDDKSFAIYEGQILSILERACKKDYQSCLILARLANQSIQDLLLQAIESDKQLGRIVVQTDFMQNITHIPTFYDEDSLYELLVSHTDDARATQYQELANSLLESACYNHDVNACIVLSHVYSLGVSVAQNRPKATRLQRMALEFATQECVLGERAMCVLLNAYPEYVQNIESDIVNIERNCKDNDALACFQANFYYTQNYYADTAKAIRDNKSDFVKAAQFLQKACQLDIKACQATLFHSKNAKECLIDNDTNACANTQSNKVEFLALSCDGGNLWSCYNLRHLPNFSETKRYVKLLQRVCRGGVIESCSELANMYQNGIRVAKNEEKAFSFIQRACNWSIKQQKDGELCYLAGRGYENGEFVKQDLQKALEVYQYACEFSSDNALACQRLGLLYETYKQDSKQALQWHKKACSKDGIARASCLRVAHAYYAGDNVEQDKEKAIELYENLLMYDGSHKKKVYLTLAKIYAQTELQEGKNPYNNFAKAIDYYDKACRLGVSVACDMTIEVPDLKQECKENNPFSCYQLALIFEVLQENPDSIKKIQSPTLRQLLQKEIGSIGVGQALTQLYATTCMEGIKQACKRLHELNNLEFIAQNTSLQQAICENLKAEKYALDYCLLFAQNALNNKDYKTIIQSLLDYENTQNARVLDLLLQSYFYTQNYHKVFELYKQIYKYNIPNNYYYLGSMYEHGLGVQQDYKIAYSIYNLTKLASSLLGQARMHENGLGTFKSTSYAKELYERACDGASSDSNVLLEACFRAGTLSLKSGDFEHARHYYSRACKNGYEGNDIVCKKE